MLGLALQVHESWEDDAPPDPARHPYVGLSWRVEGSRVVSRWRERRSRLHQVAFYRFGKAPFSLAEAGAVYDMLERTDLPSLYGVTNHYDDFAEAFAIYVHTQLLRRPYKVEIAAAKNPPRVYRSCIQTGACPRKNAFLQRLLQPPRSNPASGGQAPPGK